MVFPGPAVAITQAGRDRLVATPNEVVLYNGGTAYQRHLVSPDGDHSVFIELDDELAADVGPFPTTWVTVDSALYAAYRVLVWAPDAPPLLVDEWGMAVLAKVAAAGAGKSRTARDHRRRRLPAPGRDAAEAVKATIAMRLGDRLTLADLAAEAHYSPYHLARLFRAHTGQSVCRYRNELRVRRGIERVIEGSETLAVIAAELGFASHSHLTTAFRAAVGVRPVDLRRPATRVTALARRLPQVLTR